MLIFLIFSIDCSQNIIKNPSFEELDSNKNLKDWYNPNNVEISSPVSHSGKNSLHFKSAPDRYISAYQIINFEKGFQYEICAYIKCLNNLVQRRLGFLIRSHNLTVGFSERYSYRSYYGFDDWKRICFKTDVIKKPGINSDPYLLIIYIYPSVENSEAYIDDISIERSSFIIGLNNERDEVYDNANVVYRIYVNKEVYNLNDFELKTRIKDKDIIIFEKISKVLLFLLLIQ